MVTCLYTAEQCSAINNLSIASALQLSKSGLCNLKLCVTLGSIQKVLLSYLRAFSTSYALKSSQCSAMIAVLQTSQKFFLKSAKWQ